MKTGVDHTLRLHDGRRLGYVTFGDPEGAPVFYAHGFPGSRLEGAITDPVARRLGLRIVASDRPGFGLSDDQPGRTIWDWPADVAALAEHLGIGRFAVLGVSGGGPYALACAALLTTRITGVAIVAGLGPTVAPGAMSDMLPLHRFFLRLFRHSPRLGALFYHPLARVLRVFPGAIFSLLAATAPTADRHALRDARFRRILTDSTREAFRHGVAGARRDLHLYARDWGFPLTEIVAPVGIWHGERDVTVPIGMGRWLARALPRAQSFFLSGDGHFSLPQKHMESILSLLARAEGAEPRERLPVFVYGTLRPGEKNYAGYLEGKTEREFPGTIRGELHFVCDGGYPYVVPGEGNVRGETMVIAPEHYEETLRALDALEEYDPENENESVYLRRRVAVRLEDGTEMTAWTYYWNTPQIGERVASGDFKTR